MRLGGFATHWLTELLLPTLLGAAFFTHTSPNSTACHTLRPAPPARAPAACPCQRAPAGPAAAAAAGAGFRRCRLRRRWRHQRQRAARAAEGAWAAAHAEGCADHHARAGGAVCRWVGARASLTRVREERVEGRRNRVAGGTPRWLLLAGSSGQRRVLHVSGAVRTASVPPPLSPATSNVHEPQHQSCVEKVVWLDCRRVSGLHRQGHLHAVRAVRRPPAGARCRRLARPAPRRFCVPGESGARGTFC